MARMYATNVRMRSPETGEADREAEFYGSIWYRVDGQGDWIFAAETSDNSPWSLSDNPMGYNFDGTGVTILFLKLPETAKTLHFKASLKEYDPSVFDADEDLGTLTFEVPLPIKAYPTSFGGTYYPETGGRFRQGTSATGVAEWSICISRGGEA